MVLVGLKSDFGGHDNWHESNVYAYVGSCFGKGNNLRFVNNSCILRSDRDTTLTVACR